MLRKLSVLLLSALLAGLLLLRGEPGVAAAQNSGDAPLVPAAAQAAPNGVPKLLDFEDLRSAGARKPGRPHARRAVLRGWRP